MKKLKLFFALFAMLALGVGNAWGETVSNTWDLTSSSSDWTYEGCVTYFSQPYGIKKKGAYIINKNISDFIKYSSTATNIEIGVKSLCNGATSSKLTVSLVDASGNVVGTGLEITPDNATAASKTTYKYVTFTSNFANIAGYKVECTTFGKNVLINGTSYEITYTPSSSGETPDPTPEPEPDPDPTPGTGETWTLVTNASDLKAGDEVVIAATGYNYAMASQNGNYRNRISITKDGNNITINNDVQILTIEEGTKSNTYAFNTGSGYLYACSSSSNYLKTQDDNNDNGSWAITITNTGEASIVAQGSYTRNMIQYNASSGSERFSCYATDKPQKPVSIYKKITSSGSGSGELVASLTANPTTIDFGTKNIYFESEKQGSLEIQVTGQNLTGNVTAAISGNDATNFKLSTSSLTHNAGSVSEKLTVSYKVSEVKDYTATLTLSSDGVEAIELPITLKVINEEPATYVKVTNAVTDGEYLIVYEDATAPVAFNGALTALDAVSNTVAVEINNNIIVGNTDIDQATFTIATIEKGFSVQSKSGYYIGNTTAKNGLSSNKTDALKNEITFSEGDLTIKATNNNTPTYLRFNKASDQKRFRYFGSGQEAIALYKKASEHIVTIATCDNGSVSASVANGAKVLSGTTITLSNTPATGYKLAAYDVYKTGEETTKVTVTDGKFIMPEFDVTISATFELAKTLTGIEITNAATQTTFWQGETFNHDGLKVTAHFEGAADEDVTDKVTVAGSTDVAGSQTVTVSYAEGTTIKTTTYTINVKAIPNTKETAYTVADAFDIIDKLTTAEGVYISGIVSQVDSYNSTYKSITYWISDDGTTTKQLQAYSGKGLNGADFADINGISVDDQVIICGDLKKHTDGTYEFNYDNYLVDRIKTTKADPELSYSTTEYDVNLGDAFTAPTLNNPHTLPVTYSSSNEDVATVATDGAVTIKAAGTVVITASFAGDDTYVTGSASYTINITDPNLLEVTFDATQDLDNNNATQGAGKITKLPITFACSDGILGNSEEYRIYANATATFSAAEGYIITKVVLTSTASGISSRGPGHLSTKEGTYTYSGKVGTWVGEAYTVTLSASAQVRATTITVYYKQDNRVAAGLAWTPATISLTVGDAFTAPTFTNPNSVTGIEFTSSNTELATVDNTGVISLINGKKGSATITATYAGNETYKPADVTCVITVNPKSEKVVILAEYNGQWYALKNAEQTAGKVIAALPVNYVGGKLYNVADADKATIEWQLAIDGTIATFKNGENYISGTAGSTDMKLATTECEWTYDGSSYMIGNRTFLYRAEANGFKNYNAEDNAGTDDYSELPVVTAPVYATADLILGDVNDGATVEAHNGQVVDVVVKRSLTANDGWYTLCLPFNLPQAQLSKIGKAYIIPTDASKYTCKDGVITVNVEQVTQLNARMPYLIMPTANIEGFVAENVTIAYEDGSEGVVNIYGISDGNGADYNFSMTSELYVGGTERTNGLYWVGNGGYLYNNDVQKLALRAYFSITQAGGNGMPPRFRVVAGENVETGVGNIISGENTAIKVIENGQLIIIRDGVKYNVQGQKL